jgi:hypothetical protein
MLQQTCFPNTQGEHMEAVIPASMTAAWLTSLLTGSANVGILMVLSSWNLGRKIRLD